VIVWRRWWSLQSLAHQESLAAFAASEQARDRKPPGLNPPQRPGAVDLKFLQFGRKLA
jgi:hypothetical protein